MTNESTPLLVTIGLDEPCIVKLTTQLKAQSYQTRIVNYPNVPRCFAVDGKVKVESARISDRWLEPDGVVFYSYFEGVQEQRRALAIANTPTYPNVRKTLPFDDKVLGLIRAVDAENSAPVARGFIGPDFNAKFEGNRVAKWGNRHCGDNKLIVNDSFHAEESTILEPFFTGSSERILVVGDHAWQLHYESNDWRKNVNSTVTVASAFDYDAELLHRARITAEKLELSVVGLDYLVTPEKTILLEANTYPGFDDIPEAESVFVEEIVQWWTKILKVGYNND